MKNWPCGYPGGGGAIGATAHAIVCEDPHCREVVGRNEAILGMKSLHG